jgi:hypothetical protein
MFQQLNGASQRRQVGLRHPFECGSLIHALPFAMSAFDLNRVDGSRVPFRQSDGRGPQHLTRAPVNMSRCACKVFFRSTVSRKAGAHNSLPSARVEPSGPEIGLLYTATSGGLYAD